MVNGEFLLHKKSSFFSFFLYMRSIVICILFTAAIKTSAQINIICSRLTDSTLNYFYIGVDNPMKVVGNNVSGNITVNISGGGSSITKISANNYIVRATTVTDDCRVVINGKNGKVILQKEFKVRVIQEPGASLAGKRDTSLRKNKILLNPFLSIIIPNCYYQHNLHILSFSATFINESDSITTNAIDNFLSQEQLKQVREAISGSKIYFDNIRAIGPDSRSRKLSPFWIKIE